MEGVNVTADKRFEVLAVSKLHVQFAAVAFDQAERVKLARVAAIDECTEMTPIDLEALARAGFHAHVSAAMARLHAEHVQIILHDCDAAIEAERA